MDCEHTRLGGAAARWESRGSAKPLLRRGDELNYREIVARKYEIRRARDHRFGAHFSLRASEQAERVQFAKSEAGAPVHSIVLAFAGFCALVAVSSALRISCLILDKFFIKNTSTGSIFSVGGELEMAKGTVKWFNAAKGYGFIQPETGGKDVFVHISAVQRAGLQTLDDGQKIEYELVDNRGKAAAENLKVSL